MNRIDHTLGRGGRPLRIAYGRIFHEACADSPLRTTLADFDRMHHVRGAELAVASSLRGSELASFFPHAELTGFVAATKLAGSVATVPLTSSLAVPNGPLTRACFDALLGELSASLRDAGPVDGVYLALHGSMEVEGMRGSPEAKIVRVVREVAGPQVKIAASFDLHGNMTPELVDSLDVLVAYRTNPHWDLAPTGFRAGRHLVRLLRGITRPVHAYRKLPVVLGGGYGIDFLEPLRGVFRAMRRMRRDPRVIDTALFVVHPFTSSDELGWTVHVTTDGDPALAERLVDELADLAFEAAHAPLPRLLDVDEALEAAVRSPLRRLGPVTLVDADDIVGAGAPGGNTRLAEALIRRGDLRAVVPVHDPELYAELANTPAGSRVHVVLRGTPGYAMPAVSVTGIVAARADGMHGRRIRLDVGRVHLAISETPPLPIHPDYWRELGVEPRELDVMVQKNFFHYRIFHLAISFEHIPVSGGGATSVARARERSRSTPSLPATPLLDWREGDLRLRRPVPSTQQGRAAAGTR